VRCSIEIAGEGPSDLVHVGLLHLPEKLGARNAESDST